MVICVLFNRLELTAALGGARRELIGQPVALAPAGRDQRIGQASAAAEAFGIVSGMRVGEALARCPGLRLVPPDPEAARDYWSTIIDRLESLGAAVESDDPGLAWFEARGIERLHGGHLEGVLGSVRKRVAVPVRLAAAPTRFVSHAAAVTARRRGSVIISPRAVRTFLAPLPVGLLRARPGLEELPVLLERLGIGTLGELAAMSPSAMAERFGHPGLLALDLANGNDTPLEPRRPSELLIERLALPEAASGFQLERALEVVLERVLARRERRGRSLRMLALSARFVESGTWRVSVPLRRPTADPVKLRLALASHLGELPAPAESLALEVEAFGPPAHNQDPLVEDPADLRRARLGEAVRHVRRTTGEGALMRVLEVDPDSRLPERRAVLAPFPEEQR